MATFRLLKSGKWNVQVRISGSAPRSGSFTTREEAEQWARDQERETRKSIQTISTIHDDYMNSVMVKGGKRRGGYEATHFRLITLSRGFPQSLQSISKEDVLMYRNERLKAVSGSTVRLELQLLSRVLRWVAEEKFIECTDVVKGVKLPDAGKPRSKIITPLEYQMILEKVSDRARPIVILAWETAMRRNELLAITPAMVDLKKKIISLPDEICKNGEGRDVPLSPKAVELLKELCEGKEKGKELFTLTPYAITQAFRRAARLCKVTDVCLHSLRHTAISRWAELGFSTVQLQVISGHKSLDMLQRYTHLKASNIAEKMSLLG